jgi:hydrogenase expression/formation protein HypE
MSRRTSPEAEQATVTLAHGDGGAVMHRFLSNEILSRFGHSGLKELEDGTWIRMGHVEFILSTDSFVVDPPVFPGGDIGCLAVTGTVNDVLASGGRPRYITLALVITEGFRMDTLRRILDSARATAEEAGVEVVAGDTKVVPRAGIPQIVINTTGVGFPIIPGQRYEISRARPGDRILLTGSIGDHSLAVLSAREGLGFEQRVVTDCAPLQTLLIPLLTEFTGIRVLRDPTRGGLAGALVDIAESSMVEVLIEEDAIPVQKEVRFGCEMLGLDPLFLVNEGKMILVVASEQAELALSRLHQHPLGRQSSIIGIVRAGSPKGRVLLTRGLDERLIVRPEGQPLPKLC